MEQWFLFTGASSRLEAGCVGVDTGSDEERGFWHLRAKQLPDNTAFDPQLESTLRAIVMNGHDDVTIHLIGGERPDGSQEQISLTLRDRVVREADWYDPLATKGFVPGWASR